MCSAAKFINCLTEDAAEKAKKWQLFLRQNNFNFKSIKSIDFIQACPVVTDDYGNKFSINFAENKLSYFKKKGGLKTESISRALGAGRYGMRVLDLSAGLAIDAVFLAQMGFHVTGIERNPLIFLCLQNAIELHPIAGLRFDFAQAMVFLASSPQEFDVIYFDPMFPDKRKSALPRQEMVFFKELVGSDDDASEVLAASIRTPGIKRVVVKRPLKAPHLGLKPVASIEGKLIRFDIYETGRNENFK